MGWRGKAMQDKWLDVNGFPGYEIHPHDGIRRKGSEKTLKGRNWIGYPKVTLMKDGKKHEKRIHKLVAEHFIPNPDKKPIVNHKDSDRGNHSIDNLEWVDNSGNQLHRWETQKKGLAKIKYEKEYGLIKAALFLRNNNEHTRGYQNKEELQKDLNKLKCIEDRIVKLPKAKANELLYKKRKGKK